MDRQRRTSPIPIRRTRAAASRAPGGDPAEEFTPQAIKQAVVGTGQADKEQVIQMVRIILGLSEAPRPDHAADALAAAVTRFNTSEVAGVQ
jgi:crossover junction endodeoxyribonuclease RuvC